MADETTVPRHEQPPLTESRLPGGPRMLLRVVGRITVSIVVVLIAYWLMPTNTGDWWWAALPMTILGLLLYGVVFVRQLRRTVRADFPVLRAVEAAVLLIVLFVVLFACIAVQLSAQNSGAYSEPLNKIDALYFSVTTLTTVGYGDITPVTSTARSIGILQMLGNLAVVGVVIRIFGHAVEIGRAGKRLR